jgi:hypothetical protein
MTDPWKAGPPPGRRALVGFVYNLVYRFLPRNYGRSGYDVVFGFSDSEERQ